AGRVRALARAGSRGPGTRLLRRVDGEGGVPEGARDGLDAVAPRCRPHAPRRHRCGVRRGRAAQRAADRPVARVRRCAGRAALLLALARDLALDPAALRAGAHGGCALTRTFVVRSLPLYARRLAFTEIGFALPFWQKLLATDSTPWRPLSSVRSNPDNGMSG